MGSFKKLCALSAVGTISCIVVVMLLVTLSAQAQDYLIGGQDVLKISVFESPDLATEVRVSEAGKITFPLLGEIDAKNLTTRQLEKNIADKLSTGNFVKNPQVSVFVQQYRSSKLTIIGEVMKPGQYEIAGPTKILDTISLALGMNQNAGYLLTVFRKEASADGLAATKKITVDVDLLLNGGDLTQNIDLQNGDVIYVPKSIFYIYGEVNKPGAYRLEKGLTVRRAVSLAGGITAKGTERRIIITRRNGGKEVTSSAKIDDQVLIEDVVRVKESFF